MYMYVRYILFYYYYYYYYLHIIRTMKNKLA